MSNKCGRNAKDLSEKIKLIKMTWTRRGNIFTEMEIPPWRTYCCNISWPCWCRHHLRRYECVLEITAHCMTSTWTTFNPGSLKPKQWSFPTEVMEQSDQGHLFTLSFVPDSGENSNSYNWSTDSMFRNHIFIQVQVLLSVAVSVTLLSNTGILQSRQIL